MNMEDRLPRDLTIRQEKVEAFQSDPSILQGSRYPPPYREHVAGGIVAQAQHAHLMLERRDKNVPSIHGPDVHESHHRVVSVDDAGRGLTRDDSA
ncbi:hypothetical protein LCGC14_2036540, partial [marine sediment metagenome]